MLAATTNNISSIADDAGPELRGQYLCTTDVPTQKKSCDLCVSRKRKCDGGGSASCSFCLARGSECHYSARRKNRPRGYAKRLEEERGGDTSMEAKSVSGYGDEEENNNSMTQRQQDTPVPGWKRVRLSASPATGLVGMKESKFLASFFDCLGFFPLTNQSLARKTIIRVLLKSAPRGDDVAQKHAEPPIAEEDVEEQQAADAASACILWCSVAIGGLVRGQPPERVGQYMLLARGALSRCFDRVTEETARAFMLMTYLYNFLRDDDMFCRYLKLTRRAVDRLPENTAQREEMDDLLERGNSARIFFTPQWEPWELDAYCEDETAVLEVPNVMHKSAVGRVLNQVQRRVRKAFLREYKAQVVDSLCKRQASSTGEGTTGTVKRRCGSGPEHQMLEQGTEGGVLVEGGGEHGTSGNIAVQSTTTDAEVGPSCTGDKILATTKEAREILARLQEAAETPEFSMGVGGVLYNGVSGYLDVVAGHNNLEAGIEKSKRCAKIFARYPGLCRFSSFRHMSHILLSTLAALPEEEPYEELRQGYNSVCADNAPEAPPKEEWTMDSLCDHVFCRRADLLDKRPANQTAVDVVDTGDPEDQDSRHPDQVQQDDDESLTSCLNPELFHSQSVVPTELVPSHDWSDVVLPEDDAGGPLETSSITTLQPLDLEPVADMPDIGPNQNGESSRYAHSVLPVSGLTTAKAPAGGAGSFGPARSAVCDQGEDHCCGASASSAVVAPIDGVVGRTEPCSLESLLLSR